MTTYIKPSVEQISQNVQKIIFENNKILYLVGTAHVSAESVRLVEETINAVNPDTVAVELDDQRLEVLKNRKRYEETDIISIIRSGRTLFFAGQLLLTAYQRKIAKKTGVLPGAEFKRAIELAEERGLKLITADRNIGITLKRTIRKMGFMEKAKAMGALLFSSDSDIDESKIEELKQSDMLTQMISEMGDVMPTVKKVIIDERDIYLAAKIEHNLGNVTVAVVGAGHVPGILKTLENKVLEQELIDIEFIPSPSKLSKMLPWSIPVAVFLLLIYGFMVGGTKVAGEAILSWILITGSLAAVGTILALGHPLTIIAGFLAAPITTLNPAIGVGIVTGLVQIFIVRPKVKDIENAADDATSFKGWWSNKLTRALLVSLFSSIGASIGTFVAVPYIIKPIIG